MVSHATIRKINGWTLKFTQLKRQNHLQSPLHDFGFQPWIFLGVSMAAAPCWPGTSTFGRRRCSSEADKAWQLCFCPAVDLQKWGKPKPKNKVWSSKKLLPGNPKKSNKTKTPETFGIKLLNPPFFHFLLQVFGISLVGLGQVSMFDSW